MKENISNAKKPNILYRACAIGCFATACYMISSAALGYEAFSWFTLLFLFMPYFICLKSVKCPSCPESNMNSYFMRGVKSCPGCDTKYKIKWA